MVNMWWSSATQGYINYKVSWDLPISNGVVPFTAILAVKEHTYIIHL